MATKDPVKNRASVAKFRQKQIGILGIDEYRRRNAMAQKEYRKKTKALKNPHIQDRRGRSADISELVQVRKELRKSK